MAGDKIKAACLRKRLYITIEEAQVAQEWVRSKDRKLTIRIYHCPQCKGFHLTSKPFKRFQPVRIVW